MTAPVYTLGNQAASRNYSDGGVWVAPYGTSIASITGPGTSWPGTFHEVGWLSDAGIVEAHARQSTDVRSWQNGTLIRRITSSDDRTFSFDALEENAVVQKLARPGSTVGPLTSGLITTNVVANVNQNVWVVGFDLLDGAVGKRILATNANIVSLGNIEYKTTAESIIGFEASCYPDATTGFLYTEISSNPWLNLVYS